MDEQMKRLESFPTLKRTLDHLSETSVFYKNVYQTCADVPFDLAIAERITKDALDMCGGDWDAYTGRLKNLSEINLEFLRLQDYLEQHRNYLYTTFAEVEQNVFKKERTSDLEGVEYLWGVYFTNIFWVTHHRAFKFFINEFARKAPQTGLCLEAPTGSGIFLANFLDERPDWTAESVDISQTSTEFASNLHRVKQIASKARLITDDIFKYQSQRKFDRIICMEFIEHVEDPVSVLKKLHGLLAPGGKMFLTTVAWAAFIDHIYLYRSADEIREHIRASGFQIEKELVQNVFPKDEGKLEEREIALNYSAILTK